MVYRITEVIHRLMFVKVSRKAPFKGSLVHLDDWCSTLERLKHNCIHCRFSEEVIN